MSRFVPCTPYLHPRGVCGKNKAVPQPYCCARCQALKISKIAALQVGEYCSIAHVFIAADSITSFLRIQIVPISYRVTLVLGAKGPQIP